MLTGVLDAPPVAPRDVCVHQLLFALADPLPPGSQMRLAELDKDPLAVNLGGWQPLGVATAQPGPALIFPISRGRAHPSKANQRLNLT